MIRLHLPSSLLAVFLRGTAFGIFNLATGIAILLASVVAGELWNRYGAPVTFFAGAMFSAIALVGLLVYRPKAKN